MSHRLALICKYYHDICGKIDRKADYSIRDKYIYQSLMIYIIKHIDQAKQLSTHQDLRETITEIQVKESETARRGSAGEAHVKMNTKKIGSFQEFMEVFSHEVGGHVLDLGVIDDPFSSHLHEGYTEFGKPTFGLNDWSLRFYKISWLDETTRRADADYLDFPSGYSMKDPFEGIAEFANAWIHHHDILRKLAQNNDKLAQKYELFQELFGDWYINGDTDRAASFDLSERIFDTTKEW